MEALNRYAAIVAIAAGFAGAAATAKTTEVFKSLADFDSCAQANSYNTGYCLEPLENYAKKNPKELFAIGKKARLQFKHYAALRFFEPALGANPTAAQCADDDVGLSILSGMALPPDYPDYKLAFKLFTGTCFKSVTARIEKEIASNGLSSYIAKNACPIYAAKNIALQACVPKVEAPAAVVVPEKRPVVDLATAKLGIIKVYAGPEGERVTMADVTGQAGVFLIRVDGVRSPINGKTMVYREQQNGRNVQYVTEVDGKDWNTVVVSGDAYKAYTVYVPGVKNSFSVGYSDKDSKAAKAESLR